MSSCSRGWVLKAELTAEGDGCLEEEDPVLPGRPRCWGTLFHNQTI